MINNKQSSGLEYLIEKLKKYDVGVLLLNLHKQEIEQAKEMHKKEMVMFVLNVMGKYRNGDVLAEVAEQCYKETYGGKKLIEIANDKQ